MRRLLLFLFSILLVINSFSQEISLFPTNGVDEVHDGKYAFTHAHIQVDYQHLIADATLVIDKGKIVAVGKDVNIPPDAIVIDLRGKFIYPSFIDLYSNYGMPDVEKPKWNPAPQMESNKEGAYGWNQAIRAEFNAVDVWKADQKKAGSMLQNGFGAVLSNSMDGIARGTGVLVTLADQKDNNNILIEKASNNLSFDKGSSTQDYPSSLMGSIALIRQTYYDAAWYEKATDNPEKNLSLDAWNQNKNMQTIFDASGEKFDILRAQKIAREFSKSYVCLGTGREYQRINEVKNSGAALIIPVVFPKAYELKNNYDRSYVSLDELKHWEMAPSNAAAIAQAHIPFCFTAYGLEKPDEFLPNIRKMIKYGLNPTDALKALFYTPATFINADKILGSLEKGKLANFIICSDTLFGEKTDLLENWNQGIRYEIKPFFNSDLKGVYSLHLNGDIYRLKIDDEANQLKAKVMNEDSSMVSIDLTVNDPLVKMGISIKDEGFYSLTGVSSANRLNGKATDQHGQELIWFAEKTDDINSLSKKDSVIKPEMGNVIYPFVAYGNEAVPTENTYLIKSATIWTGENKEIIENGDVFVKNGKIAAIGKNLNAGTNVPIINAQGKYLTAGIIDEHSHICISQGVNEGTEASSSEVRIGDVINSEDINMYRQLAGGVTMAQLLHGSANPIGGQSALIKFRWGKAPEELKYENAPPFIKFALGENVKQSNWGDLSTVRFPQSRMGVEQVYVNYFTKALEYKKTRSQHRDLKLDALLEILEGKRFITCHSYVQSEINMLMHVADSFDFKVNTFTHILEGYKVADKLKAHEANSSTFSDWWAYKYEVIDAIPHNAGILSLMGINTCINSDDAEMGRRLNQEAAKSIRYMNMSEQDAWAMVTINSAKALHVDDKVGSIKVGKDADLVLWTDNPLSIYAKAEKTFVDGVIYYDRDKESAEINTITQERNRIIQKMIKESANEEVQKPVKKKQQEYRCAEDHFH